MAITVEELDGSLSRIVWKTTMRLEVGYQERTFHLGPFHPNSFAFTASSSYSLCGEPTKENKDSCFIIRVGLIQPKSPSTNIMKIQSTSEKQDDSINITQFQEQPIAVLISINGSSKIPMKESSVSPTSIVWISEECLVSFLPQDLSSQSDLFFPLTCRFWIKFESDKICHREKNVQKKLTDLFVLQICCDVKFIFSGDVHIGGHLAVLAARSPVFSAMFQPDMQQYKTGSVFVRDVHPEIFEQLLYFIYSGRTWTPLTEVIVQPLYVAAFKFGICDLKRECVSFLLSSIRKHNVLPLLAWSHVFSVDKVKEAALEFVAKNNEEDSLRGDLMKLSLHHPDLSVEVTRRIVARLSMSGL